jgi:hypothetical protein
VPTLTAQSEYCNPDRTSPSGLYLLEDHLTPANSRCYSDPIATLTSRGRELLLTFPDGGSELFFGDPFHWLSEYLHGNPEQTAVGYWGYDVRHCVERLPNRTLNDLHLPEMHVALCEGPVPYEYASHPEMDADGVGGGRLRQPPGTAFAETLRAGINSQKAELSVCRREYLSSIT